MFYTIDSYRDMIEHYDFIVDGVVNMIGRAMQENDAAESIIKMMLKSVGKDTTFFLLHKDDNNEPNGLVFALLMGTECMKWVEIIAMFTKPLLFRGINSDAHELLVKWAKPFGATKILAFANRRTQHDGDMPGQFLFNHFYKPLGYMPVGMMIKRELE